MVSWVASRDGDRQGCPGRASTVGAAQMEQPWVLRSESGVKVPLGLENPLFGIQPSPFSPSSPHGPAVRAMSFASLLGSD
jgi:hypothetical protein